MCGSLPTGAKQLAKKATKRTAKGKEIVQPDEMQRRRRAARERLKMVQAADPEDSFRATGRGRHSSYSPEYARQATALCKLGATDKELAEFFNVDVKTIKNWENAHKTFFHALKRGKAEADERVERALYSKAMGYTYETEKIFYDSKVGEVVRVPTQEHIPPSDTAISLWLRNRKPSEWRDKTEHDHTHSVDMRVKSDNMSVADAQALFRQTRNMSLADLERSMKLIEHKPSEEDADA